LRAPFRASYVTALNVGFITMRSAQKGEDRLTMTRQVLLKRNYNLMNQPFLAALVKIHAAKFTKPMLVVN
jgi:hypothetical protein